MKKIIIILSLLAGCKSLFSATFNITNGDVAGLIAAINTANTNGQADIINLAANGTYNLMAINYTSANPGQDGYEAQRGFPDIANNVNGLDLTINGNGATIQRNTSAPDFGFFSCTGQTAFNNITFRNARVNGQGAAIFVQFKGNVEVNNCSFYDNISLITVGERGGGAIYTKSFSTLTVTNSYFENNRSVHSGGAISNLLSNMTLIGNTFKNNRTTRSVGSVGGAVYSDGARGDNGFLIIRNNIFEGNSNSSNNNNIVDAGGAMFLFPYRNQSVEVTGCTFKKNSSRVGGALWHQGGSLNQTQANDLADAEFPFTAGPENTTLIFNNCIFDGNTASYIGGGIWFSNCIVNEIYNCTFKNNTAELGGGLYAEITRPLTIRNSTFNNNTANIAGALISGDTGNTISGITAKLTVQNCTFAANIANLYGAAMAVPQNNTTRPVDIINCTFAGNQVTHPTDGRAGAIFSGSTGVPNTTVMIKNTIFYNQTALWTNTKDCNASLINGGNNLFFPGNNTGGCTATPGNSLFANPLLGPLVNNGGPTQTMALQVGSPAINAGSGCPPADQRGVTRVGNCDIGAYEYTNVLSIEEIVENKNNLVVYPNPSTGNFFIKVPKEYKSQGGSIQIFSLDGKLILTKNIDKGDIIPLSLNTKGVYILKTTIGGEIFSHKIVVN